jgi:multiple sugar transport system substrate-binding protein
LEKPPFDSIFYVGHITEKTVREGAMTKKNSGHQSASFSRRTLLQASAATLGATAFPMPGIAQTKPFAGVTLRGASFQHRFFTLLQNYIPEFETQTGMKVDLQLSAFPVYNQQANLELSSGGSAFDFVNVTFILAARWVAAGLLANLDEFTGDPNLTPAEWKPKDFVEGAQVPYRDAKGATYGYSWEGGAMVMGLSRMDLMEKKGLKIPKTFAELQQVCAEINGTDGVTGLVSFQLHHWCLPPYIQGFGGNIFRNPPTDIMPALNSPEAIQAVEFYANLLKNYAPKGVLTYTEDQARQALLTGRSNIFIHSSAWITPIVLSNESKVKDTARVVRMPAGPMRDFPAANSQGLGIPKNAKNKKAAWEFIKWALSPEISMRLVKEHGHSSVCRRSVIESEEYRKLNTVNGQDLGALHLEVLGLPAKGENYMAYRTVKEFPIVGDVLNKAFEQVATGQLAAPAAMNAAQEQAVANMRRAGTAL